MNHLLLSKESPAISGRRGLPLAIAILHVSDPQVAAMEALSKMSHDGDMPTAHAAIIGLGLISAGTNNARVAAMLRSLSGYYSKDLETLYVVRLAQGLCALGKGMLTLAPSQLDRAVVSNAALAGVLTLLHSGLNTEKTLLDKYHFMAFSVVTAIAPRMLHTVDAALEPVATQVRVGTAVDTVAMSGRPKTITGFQTHAAPVLLQHAERAELVPGKMAVAVPGTTLEGVVIVQPVKVVDEDAAAA
jgi:26S proteasome regulatory subunit N1